MTDESIIWLSLMSEGGTEIFQVSQENGDWALDFTTASPLRDGNLVFRFDDGPPVNVSWNKLAQGRRSAFSEGNLAPLIANLRTATKLRIQYFSLDDSVKVARLDVQGFDMAAAKLPMEK